MLLTLPWAMCTFLGRVDIDNGHASYNKKPAKLTRGFSLTRTGTEPTKDIPMNAKIMIGTAFVYILIQGPSFAFTKDSDEVRGCTAHTRHACVSQGVGPGSVPLHPAFSCRVCVGLCVHVGLCVSARACGS